MGRPMLPRIVVAEKRCSHCKETKTANNFYAVSRNPDGLCNRCKTCVSIGHKRRIERNRGGRDASEVLRSLPPRVCRKCNNEKPATEFRIAWGSKKLTRATCNQCTYDVVNEKRRLGIGAHHPLIRKASYRKFALLYHWGLTQSDYDTMLALQGGGCAVCGAREPGGRTKNFHIDHDHETGEIRGLLCSRHNVGLGHFDDSIEMLEKALAYLRKPPARRLKFRLVKEPSNA